LPHRTFVSGNSSINQAARPTLKKQKNEKLQKTTNPGKTDNRKGVKRHAQSTPEDMHRTTSEMNKKHQIKGIPGI